MWWPDLENGYFQFPQFSSNGELSCINIYKIKWPCVLCIWLRSCLENLWIQRKAKWGSPSLGLEMNTGPMQTGLPPWQRRSRGNTARPQSSAESLNSQGEIRTLPSRHEVDGQRNGLVGGSRTHPPCRQDGQAVVLGTCSQQTPECEPWLLNNWARPWESCRPHKTVGSVSGARKMQRSGAWGVFSEQASFYNRHFFRSVWREVKQEGNLWKRKWPDLPGLDHITVWRLELWDQRLRLGPWASGRSSVQSEL